MASPLTHWEGEPVEVWRALWGVPGFEAWARLGSTNDRARAGAADGAAPFWTVVAEHQTRGRGRGGSVWEAEEGASLLVSMVLPGEAPSDSTLPLKVGLAAARAVEAVCPTVSVGLKWPNDLYVHGRKVGGILCEASADGVVAGLGLNVTVPDGGFPPELAGRAAALEEVAEHDVARAALLGRFLREARALCAGSTPGFGLEGWSDLARRDILAGRRVRTRSGTGEARGIDRDGALLLTLDDGRAVRVVGGSVVPLEGPAAPDGHGGKGREATIEQEDPPFPGTRTG